MAAGGVTTGIAGGDATSAGIAVTGSASGGSASPSGGGTPRAADVDAGLFGETSARSAQRGIDRKQHLDSTGEGAERGGAQTSGGLGRGGTTRTGSEVTGRGAPSGGLSLWLNAENPLVMMRRMQDDLDRVFRAFGLPRLGPAIAPPRELEEALARSSADLGPSTRWAPQVDVFERDGNLVVHADLPGVRREDVEVNVENDLLVIRGQRRQEHLEAEGGYRRTERSYGTFLRQIPLPEGVDPEGIEASYDNGVLEVVVPPPEEQRAGRRRVQIR
jgi:HSP20 family protein